MHACVNCCRSCRHAEYVHACTSPLQRCRHSATQQDRRYVTCTLDCANYVQLQLISCIAVPPTPKRRWQHYYSAAALSQLRRTSVACTQRLAQRLRASFHCMPPEHTRQCHANKGPGNASTQALPPLGDVSSGAAAHVCAAGHGSGAKTQRHQRQQPASLAQSHRECCCKSVVRQERAAAATPPQEH